MICQNCKTYYVRAPCPSCGDDPRKKTDNEETQKLSPSQIRQRESGVELDAGNQVLVQKTEEERLVKPSERFKQEREENEDLPSFQRIEKDDGGERLVKPSERIKQDEDQDDENIPSFKKFERTKEETSSSFTTPTKVSKVEKEEDVPSFKQFETQEEKSLSDLDKISADMKDQHGKLKNDGVYRSKVKETLEEVMGLLERLIEDD